MQVEGGGGLFDLVFSGGFVLFSSEGTIDTQSCKDNALQYKMWLCRL